MWTPASAGFFSEPFAAAATERRRTANSEAARERKGVRLNFISNPPGVIGTKSRLSGESSVRGFNRDRLESAPWEASVIIAPVTNDSATMSLPRQSKH